MRKGGVSGQRGRSLSGGLTRARKRLRGCRARGRGRAAAACFVEFGRRTDDYSRGGKTTGEATEGEGSAECPGNGAQNTSGPLPRANIDGKVKADLEDLARTGAEVNKLKQKVNDLVKELKKEQEKNQYSHHDFSKESKKGEDDRGTAVNKEADAKSISSSHFVKRSISRKESDRIQTENDGPELSTSYSTRLSNQLLDSLNYSRSRHSGQPSSSRAPEPHVRRSLPPTSSRRSVSKTELTSTTSTALTKLTSRLNFLKERRSQIANELKNLGKSRSSAQATQIPDKGKASEGQLVTSLGKKFDPGTSKSNKYSED